MNKQVFMTMTSTGKNLEEIGKALEKIISALESTMIVLNDADSDNPQLSPEKRGMLISFRRLISMIRVVTVIKQPDFSPAYHKGNSYKSAIEHIILSSLNYELKSGQIFPIAFFNSQKKNDKAIVYRKLGTS